MNYKVILTSILFLCAAAHADARHLRHSRHPKPARAQYSWDGHQVDLSPVSVQPYQLPAETDPAHANYLRRMNLENGVFAKATHYITRPDVNTRDLFILDITQSLEGGFDSVNIYDKGILSWGLMQWTVRTGSLPRALLYIKTSLRARKEARVWDKTFVANGLDVDCDGLIVYGKRVNTPLEMRLAFRGTGKVSQFDPKLVTHWVTTMARAGRQPQIAALEIAYASHTVDAVLERRLEGLPYHAPGRSGLTAIDLAASDPYSEALIFALWTNNPRNAIEYVNEAARAARSASVTDDPALWVPGAFSDALLRRCQSSRFGNWKQRAAMINARSLDVRTASIATLSPFEAQYQQILIARKSLRLMQLASRRQKKRTPEKLEVSNTSVQPPAFLLKEPGIRPMPVTPNSAALLPMDDAMARHNSNYPPPPRSNKSMAERLLKQTPARY